MKNQLLTLTITDTNAVDTATITNMTTDTITNTTIMM